jgi:hypothetical protein
MESEEKESEVETEPALDQQEFDRRLKFAIEIRNLELRLYWTRTAYFWTLLAAAFAGYVAIETQIQPANATNAGSLEIPRFVLACIGLVFSTAWYMVNRGSKYWQKTWERHIDLLPDDPVSRMFRTRLDPSITPFYKLLEPYPFSVSKTNQALSFYITVVWLILAIRAFPLILWPKEFENDLAWFFVFITFIFLISLLLFARTDKEKGTIKVKMITRKVRLTKSK